MNKIYKIALIFSVVSLPMIALAQEKVEMADVLRSNGKIYAVVAVCLTILIGIFLYLLLLDRKIKRLEK